MNLEEEKQNFAKIIDRVPEILMNSPSFPLELAEHFNDIPFLSSPENPRKNNCFCEREDDDGQLVYCSCCGEASHLPCYHFSDKPFPSSEQFLCIYCQYKASSRIAETLLQNAAQIEDKLRTLTEKFDNVEKEFISQTPDAFGCIQNATSCGDLDNALSDLIAESQNVWKDITNDLETLNSFTDIDIFDQKNSGD